ncbi:MAG: thrombospondin type 3 repeat-containing protein [Polyangiales bacterium]
MRCSGGGQVAVDETGVITCVGCDCATATGAAGATKLVWPERRPLPGFINAHDHITYVKNDPYDSTEERYEHRHDWRSGGNRGHTGIPAGGSSSNAQKAWGELRFVMGGATAINGSGDSAGFLRNVDKTEDASAIAHKSVYYETFPLDDSSGTLRASGCFYGSDMQLTTDLDPVDAYTPHVSEGIDAEARNEFLCLRSGEHDIITPKTAIIHGVGLLTPDIAEMSLDGTSLIWSPRTNITLYGDTARVPVYATLGVRIALGTVWVVTGSMNMLRELRCADELNTLRYNSYFTDEQLWLMATRDSAASMAIDNVLGVIQVGGIADLAMFDGATHADHRAILDATPASVVMVMRGGKVLYGDDSVVSALAPSDGCDAINVCGTAKRACVSREYGQSYSELEASVSGMYPLFFCDEPENEPSCVPSRDAMDPYPDPERNGSTRYSGEITANDMDGDGIPDDVDNCLLSFNPVRPVDQGVQADFDGDGLGDECDPCPMDPGKLTCDALDPNDRDGDGIPNDQDNCPVIPNPAQSNKDGDAYGDECDFCPDAKNGEGAGCPASIYDIQMGTIPVGSPVTVGPSVVTAIGQSGFFMQVPPGSDGYTGAARSGLYVYTGAGPTVARGDLVSVSLAYVNEYRGQKQLGSAVFTANGTAAVPAPVAVGATDVAPGGAMAVALESVLVETRTPP